MKKFLSIVLMVLLVLSPVMIVDAKTTATKKTTTSAKATTKSKTTTKKTTTKKTTPNKTTEENNKKPVRVYVFYSSSCGYCAALHSYLDELKEDKTYGKMFEVVDYEVSSSSENSDLMDEVVNYFDQEYSGVPIYVIGSEYMSGYSKETHNDKIKSAIKKAYEDQAEDKVAKVVETFKNKKDNNIIGYVVLGIVAVIIVGVIYSSSKNSYYDDENEETEDDSDTKTTKAETKSQEKKVDSKKTSSTAKRTTTKKKTTKKSSK